MSTASIHRYRAVLLVLKIKILLVLALAKGIHSAMLAAVAIFPSPLPPLATLLAQITTLETAQQVVASGVRGVATATRNAARDALWGSLLSLRAYVQTIADAAVDGGVEVIKASGFSVAAFPPPRDKPLLAAKLTVVSGEVKLSANARALAGVTEKRAIYNWEYSIDGGHTWLSVPPTVKATATIEGLPVMTTCNFRVCVTLAGVMQPWSPVVSLAVH